MKSALALRLVAIAIAIAGVADPVITRTTPVTQPLTITIVESPSLDLPDGTATRRARALAVAEQLQTALSDAYSVVTQTRSTNNPTAVCPQAGSCVVISDGAAPRRLVSASASTPPFIAAVHIGRELSPNVSLQRVAGPSAADVFSVAALTVDLRGVGVRGQSSVVQVFDETTLIGSATHQWANEETASVRLEWTPVARGVRHLRVVAQAVENEATALDNEADVGIEVRDRAVNVLVFEPQPTWGGTFVRRALERDARFIVRTRTRPASSVTLTTGAEGAGSLDRPDAAVILVGAPEALRASDVEALNRFARRRGGSVILIANQPLTGAVTQLVPLRSTERRLAQPITIGPLRASEFLTFDAAVGTTAIASADRPVVISHATGRGRVIVSGAIDAWRYRGEAYSAFWTSLVADAAAAVPPSLDIVISPSLLRPAEDAKVTVEWNPADSDITSVDAMGMMTCGDHVRPLRLWPSGRPGRFEADVTVDREGECRIDVRVDEEATGSAMLLVDRDVKPAPAHADSLAHVVAVHGGMTVDAAQHADVVTALRARAERTREAKPSRPMRSPWWIVPFAGCLGGEWWLRRRRGLR